MDIISQLLEKAPPEAREAFKRSETMSDYRQKQINTMNAIPGDLKGYDCPICKNKGVIYRLADGNEVCHTCECMTIRKNLERVRKSGIQNLLDTYTFDRFETSENWQSRFKDDAFRFLKDHKRKWFFAGGQVGAGKTHLCTAIMAEFLTKGVPAKYMLWRDEAVKLKAVVNDESEYYRLINPLKRVPVLYIDDFFKTPKSEDGRRKPPTQGDVNVAFEILNYRYNNDCVTIISSERTIDELLDCDEAVGSRIYQRTKDHCWNFGQDRAKNYRLR